ncbi:carotenoid biosynthesis protein [Candidatus Woesebacteria bacterium]|nr:carotenoid biosynthesis protein [Candidatus Woesebacteria bacterium]
MIKVLWTLFAVTILLTIVDLFGLLLGFDLFNNDTFRLLFLTHPVILLLLHATYTKGIIRGLALIVLASFVGWFMETLGLKWGTVFGGIYSYGGNTSVIGIVPVPVVCYWGVFIYTGYSVVNSFYYWVGKQLPNISRTNHLILLLTIIADGLLVTFIDLFMDPIQVAQKAWAWLDGGPYFGVPIGNFIGWFVVTVIATGSFRIYEYLYPRSEKIDSNIHLIPVIGYGLLALSFAISSIQLELFSLLFIGLPLMVPVVVVNFMLYLRRGRGRIGE